MSRVRLVVTDLDNTLYSWVGYVVFAIEAMLDSLVSTTGFERDHLLESLQEVYHHRGSIEYPFVLQEASIFQERLADFERFAEDVLIPARQAFAAQRRSLLRPYPTVVSTLERLKAQGIPVVGLSDASSFAATLRLRMLGLDRYLDALYAIEPYSLPPPDRMERRILEKLEAGLYEPETLKVHPLPLSAVKPSPEGFMMICEDFGVRPEETVMIGDNLTKDIGLAQAVGALGLWAEYGTIFEPDIRRRLEHYVPRSVLRRNAPEFEGSAIRPGISLSHYEGLFSAATIDGG